MAGKKTLIRITTVPMSLNILLRFQLRFMDEHYRVVAIADPEGGLEDVTPREGVMTIGVPMTRAITPLKDLKALWLLYKLFKKEKPLIVHTHTPKAGVLGMLAGKLAGVPIRLHTVAGLPLLEATGNKRKLLDEVEKLTYRCAHMVYPNSTELKNIIVSNALCRPDKLKVIGNGSTNGIDTTFFSPSQVSEDAKIALRRELGIAHSDFVYCFVGRMVSDKGINELVQAFANIAVTDTRAKLILVGPFEKELDPLKPETEEKIQAMPAIKWVGYQADVRPYLAISDVFVFPSYREGFPNVVMQAGAMGLPSVVSNINGCNEIVQEEVNGFIIPVKNSEALQAKMELLKNDGELRTNMASSCRSIIENCYKREYVWNEILKEYKMQEELQAS
ncbi:MAG: glycosyltransferase family 1 protein [Sphingobacteriales bacterium]|nr:MAG: glycosyltransferase family 1 protein [Sphingobacteriales bacterium]